MGLEIKDSSKTVVYHRDMSDAKTQAKAGDFKNKSVTEVEPGKKKKSKISEILSNCNPRKLYSRLVAAWNDKFGRTITLNPSYVPYDFAPRTTQRNSALEENNYKDMPLSQGVDNEEPNNDYDDAISTNQKGTYSSDDKNIYEDVAVYENYEAIKRQAIKNKNPERRVHFKEDDK